MMPTALKQLSENLLKETGYECDFVFHLLSGGKNNQVYRVETDDKREVLLKAYFQHPDDPRDRLGAEYAFAQFAWRQGVRALPEPFAVRPDSGIALYEYIQGRRLESAEIDENALHAAMDFFADINQHRTDPAATALPQGSEACFSMAAHLELVQKRVERLRRLQPSTEVEHQAAQFITNELLKTWQQVEDVTRDFSSRIFPGGLEQKIPRKDQRISPSDFGFHNSLLKSSGQLCFIDFEYAGWDDPAKTICDFFCQPALPAPEKYFDMFLESILHEIDNFDIARKRSILLLPVFRIKWTCMLLNEFVPAGIARRNFSKAQSSDMESLKYAQLKKARAMLDSAMQARERSLELL